MARKSKIRWRESDVKELERLINNFNQKLYRTKKNKPELAEYLPQRMNKADAIASIETRDDLKRLQGQLSRFTQRGAEKPFESSRGLKTTQWAVDEFKRNQRAENIRRAKRKKELGEKEVKRGGQPTGAKRKEMGKIKENAVKPSKKNPARMSAEEFEKASKLFEAKMRESYTEEQKRNMQINYIRGLIHEGYSDELANYLTTIPTEKFLEIIDTDETATFDFIYDPINRQTKEDILWDVWEEHGTGTNVLGASLDEILYDEWLRGTGKHLTYRDQFIRG